MSREKKIVDRGQWNPQLDYIHYNHSQLETLRYGISIVVSIPNGSTKILTICCWRLCESGKIWLWGSPIAQQNIDGVGYPELIIMKRVPKYWHWYSGLQLLKKKTRMLSGEYTLTKVQRGGTWTILKNWRNDQMVQVWSLM